MIQSSLCQPIIYQISSRTHASSGIHSAPSSIVSHEYGSDEKLNEKRTLIVDTLGNFIYPGALKDDTKNNRSLDPIVSQKSKLSIKLRNKSFILKSRKARRTTLKKSIQAIKQQPSLKLSIHQPKFLSTDTQTDPEIYQKPSRRTQSSSRSASTTSSNSQKIYWKREMEADLNEFEKLYFQQQRNGFHESGFDYKLLALSVLTLVIFVVILWGIGSSLWNTNWPFIRFFKKLLMFDQSKADLSNAETVFKFITKLFGKSRR